MRVSVFPPVKRVRKSYLAVPKTQNVFVIRTSFGSPFDASPAQTIRASPFIDET
jgi:hypothetical protein